MLYTIAYAHYYIDYRIFDSRFNKISMIKTNKFVLYCKALSRYIEIDRELKNGLILVRDRQNNIFKIRKDAIQG